MEISFRHVVNSVPMILNTRDYTNAAGETFRITAFKYYISNIRLVRMDNSELTLPAEYFLVDEADTASHTVRFMAPEGEYRALVFTLGVDSARNVSGAQTGALDPVKGMFWSWNSGYIMAKLEGTAPASTQLDKKLAFHIGGFKTPYNAAQEIRLTLPVSIMVGEMRQPKVVINADAYAWFLQPNLVSFATSSAIHTPGEAAWKIAVNYRNMFRIVEVDDL